MKVEELIARFPEIPEGLRKDPGFETYAEVSPIPGGLSRELRTGERQ